MSGFTVVAFVVGFTMLIWAIHGLRDRVSALEKRLGVGEAEQD
jgi:hypothetical protein